MKGCKSLVSIALVLSVAMIPSAVAADKTSSKAAGPAPTIVVNTILSGAGVPAKTLGINGDFYIDTKNLNLYGPKAKGVWKITTSLRPREVSASSSVIGQSGAIGQTGAKGETGATGDRGATGQQGIPGVTGAIGATGLVGANGLAGFAGPSGIAGAKGDAGAQGFPGVKGDTGSQGVQGVKGDTGTAGTPGDSAISSAKFATVPAATLAITTAGNSTSHVFFTAGTSGNYTFEVIVAGIANFSDTFKLNAEIVIGNSAIADQFVIASDSNSNANGISGRQYGFTLIGAAANVSAGAVFALRITNQVAVSGGTSINFIGRALINKVGSIG